MNETQKKPEAKDLKKSNANLTLGVATLGLLCSFVALSASSDGTEAGVMPGCGCILSLAGPIAFFNLISMRRGKMDLAGKGKLRLATVLGFIGLAIIFLSILMPALSNARSRALFKWMETTEHPYVGVIMGEGGTAKDIKDIASRGHDVNKRFRIPMNELLKSLEDGSSMSLMRNLSLLEDSQIKTLESKSEEIVALVESIDSEFASYTPLHVAITFQSKDPLIRQLLLAGADPNSTDMVGNSATMYWAQMRNDIKLLPFLLESGADLNAVNRDGQSPLHGAAMIQNTPEVISALIENGANVNLKDALDQTPLYIALVFNSNTEIVLKLIDSGANVNIAGPDNCPNIHAAVDRYNIDGTDDCVEVINALIEAGADVNATWEVSENATAMDRVLHIALFEEIETNSLNSLTKVFTALSSAGGICTGVFDDLITGVQDVNGDGTIDLQDIVNTIAQRWDETEE